MGKCLYPEFVQIVGARGLAEAFDGVEGREWFEGSAISTGHAHQHQFFRLDVVFAVCMAVALLQL